MSEMEAFLAIWERESKLTSGLLRSIPQDGLDFRPDPKGRSLGELAWHLAEIEAIFSTIAQQKNFKTPPPAGLERPATAGEMASGYERIHREALERVRALTPEDLGTQFPFLGGETISVRGVLRYPLLHHLIHHRGQLMMMIRMAHAVPAHVYGPNREDDAAMRREIAS
jgi:uncharacterized damage-inducible protein DinB